MEYNIENKRQRHHLHIQRSSLTVKFYLALALFVTLFTTQAAASTLGSKCQHDMDCTDFIKGSSCSALGYCECAPYYVQYNSTTCLSSQLLGGDCILNEQCTMKVSNSSCLDGACRCVEGFLQFRKHTCLGPAPPGSVCYSHAHCQMFSSKTHCDFLIPNLFGRCQCTAPAKLKAGNCVEPAAEEAPAAAAPASTSTTTTTTTSTSTSAPKVETEAPSVQPQILADPQIVEPAAAEDEEENNVSVEEQELDDDKEAFKPTETIEIPTTQQSPLTPADAGHTMIDEHHQVVEEEEATQDTPLVTDDYPYKPDYEYAEEHQEQVVDHKVEEDKAEESKPLEQAALEESTKPLVHQEEEEHHAEEYSDVVDNTMNFDYEAAAQEEMEDQQKAEAEQGHQQQEQHVVQILHDEEQPAEEEHIVQEAQPGDNYQESFIHPTTEVSLDEPHEGEGEETNYVNYQQPQEQQQHDELVPAANDAEANENESANNEIEATTQQQQQQQPQAEQEIDEAIMAHTDVAGEEPHQDSVEAAEEENSHLMPGNAEENEKEKENQEIAEDHQTAGQIADSNAVEPQEHSEDKVEEDGKEEGEAEHQAVEEIPVEMPQENDESVDDAHHVPILTESQPEVMEQINENVISQASDENALEAEQTEGEKEHVEPIDNENLHEEAMEEVHEETSDHGVNQETMGTVEEQHAVQENQESQEEPQKNEDGQSMAGQETSQVHHDEMIQFATENDIATLSPSEIEEDQEDTLDVQQHEEEAAQEEHSSAHQEEAYETEESLKDEEQAPEDQSHPILADEVEEEHVPQGIQFDQVHHEEQTHGINEEAAQQSSNVAENEGELLPAAAEEQTLEGSESTHEEKNEEANEEAEIQQLNNEEHVLHETNDQEESLNHEEDGEVQGHPSNNEEHILSHEEEETHETNADEFAQQTNEAEMETPDSPVVMQDETEVPEKQEEHVEEEHVDSMTNQEETQVPEKAGEHIESSDSVVVHEETQVPEHQGEHNDSADSVVIHEETQVPENQEEQIHAADSVVIHEETQVPENLGEEIASVDSEMVHEENPVAENQGEQFKDQNSAMNQEEHDVSENPEHMESPAPVQEESQAPEHQEDNIESLDPQVANDEIQVTENQGEEVGSEVIHEEVQVPESQAEQINAVDSAVIQEDVQVPEYQEEHIAPVDSVVIHEETQVPENHEEYHETDAESEQIDSQQPTIAEEGPESGHDSEPHVQELEELTQPGYHEIPHIESGVAQIAHDELPASEDEHSETASDEVENPKEIAQDPILASEEKAEENYSQNEVGSQETKFDEAEEQNESEQQPIETEDKQDASETHENDIQRGEEEFNTHSPLNSEIEQTEGHSSNAEEHQDSDVTIEGLEDSTNHVNQEDIKDLATNEEAQHQNELSDKTQQEETLKAEDQHQAESHIESTAIHHPDAQDVMLPLEDFEAITEAIEDQQEQDLENPENNEISQNPEDEESESFAHTTGHPTDDSEDQQESQPTTSPSEDDQHSSELEENQINHQEAASQEQNYFQMSLKPQTQYDELAENEDDFHHQIQEPVSVEPQQSQESTYEIPGGLASQSESQEISATMLEEPEDEDVAQNASIMDILNELMKEEITVQPPQYSQEELSHNPAPPQQEAEEEVPDLVAEDSNISEEKVVSQEATEALIDPQDKLITFYPDMQELQQQETTHQESQDKQELPSHPPAQHDEQEASGDDKESSGDDGATFEHKPHQQPQHTESETAHTLSPHEIPFDMSGDDMIIQHELEADNLVVETTTLSNNDLYSPESEHEQAEATTAAGIAELTTQTMLNLASRVTLMEPAAPVATTLKPLMSASEEIVTPEPQHLEVTVSEAAAFNRKPSTTEIRKRVELSLEAVSLGLGCSNDKQCQLADPNTVCNANGVCDCAANIYSHSNMAEQCGAQKTGCSPGTFQCRSSGVCISWFFVCDGRSDCNDASDEECSFNPRLNQTCPEQAFRCGNSGRCISRAALCDGRKQCPHGEDEMGCVGLKANEACPPNTFRCKSGECLPEYEYCNAIISCRDGSDEPPHLCGSRSMPNFFLQLLTAGGLMNKNSDATAYCPHRCSNGRCRSTAIVCSGRDGCGDGTDEQTCSVCRCPAVDKPALHVSDFLARHRPLNLW
ncbi:trichohyalin [Musca domestica]|uniref:Trichohyalin n=1 Tax=Musca domestica TaxID=7370 RepID=A0A1I8MVM2_MUSDO|nr:trichohyalin [Musca domestica]